MVISSWASSRIIEDAGRLVAGELGAWGRRTRRGRSLRYRPPLSRYRFTDLGSSSMLFLRLAQPLSVARSYAKRGEPPGSANSDLRGPPADPLAVDLSHRAHVVFGVLPHPLVVDLGDHRGDGQRILEISSQLQGVVEVL
jgi:hypothetical protein